MAQMMFRDALRAALALEMKRDPKVFVIGEEVGRYGGAYAVTKGLYDEFGAERLVDTPISEASVVGLGVGAALTGLRPVVELMYVDFVGLAMDQISNQMAKWRYMSGGKVRCPWCFARRAARGRSAGAQHSQSLETWLAHMPGLRVVMPSNPADAKGLLSTAIRSDDPVVFIEHKALYAMKGDVPDGEHLVPLERQTSCAGGRRYDRQLLPDGSRCFGGRGYPGKGRHRGRGDRSSHAESAGHGDGARIRAENARRHRGQRGAQDRRLLLGACGKDHGRSV